MSRKHRRRHHNKHHAPSIKPAIRPADGWVLYQCTSCGAEFYYKPGTSPFCVNNCGQYAKEEEAYAPFRQDEPPQKETGREI